MPSTGGRAANRQTVAARLAARGHEAADAVANAPGATARLIGGAAGGWFDRRG